MKKLFMISFLILLICLFAIACVSCDDKPETKQVLANRSTTVYVTKYGDVYHSRYCSYIADKSNSELLYASIREAEEYGYDPCSKCTPNYTTVTVNKEETVNNNSFFTKNVWSSLIASGVLAAIFIAIGIKKRKYWCLSGGIAVPLAGFFMGAVSFKYNMYFIVPILLGNLLTFPHFRIKFERPQSVEYFSAIEDEINKIQGQTRELLTIEFRINKRKLRKIENFDLLDKDKNKNSFIFKVILNCFYLIFDNNSYQFHMKKKALQDFNKFINTQYTNKIIDADLYDSAILVAKKKYSCARDFDFNILTKSTHTSVAPSVRISPGNLPKLPPNEEKFQFLIFDLIRIYYKAIEGKPLLNTNPFSSLDFVLFYCFLELLSFANEHNDYVSELYRSSMYANLLVHNIEAFSSKDNFDNFYTERTSSYCDMIEKMNRNFVNKTNYTMYDYYDILLDFLCKDIWSDDSDYDKNALESELGEITLDLDEKTKELCDKINALALEIVGEQI